LTLGTTFRVFPKTQKPGFYRHFFGKKRDFDDFWPLFSDVSRGPEPFFWEKTPKTAGKTPKSGRDLWKNTVFDTFFSGDLWLLAINTGQFDVFSDFRGKINLFHKTGAKSRKIGYFWWFLMILSWFYSKSCYMITNVVVIRFYNTWVMFYNIRL
jgi:hypothetical protein